MSEPSSAEFAAEALRDIMPGADFIFSDQLQLLFDENDRKKDAIKALREELKDALTAHPDYAGVEIVVTDGKAKLKKLTDEVKAANGSLISQIEALKGELDADNLRFKESALAQVQAEPGKKVVVKRGADILVAELDVKFKKPTPA